MGTIWDFIPVIIATFVGFCLLAAILLVPVYLFLKREERASDAWTPQALAERRKRHAAQGNGHADTPETPPSTPPS